jgi:hypothetical protein
MADDEIAGPSRPKRSRVSSKKFLSDAELREILENDSSDEEFDGESESDCGWLENSDEDDSSDDHDDNDVTGHVPISVPHGDSSNSEEEVSENVVGLNSSWVDGPPNLKVITFTGNSGLRVAAPQTGKPIDYFFLFANDEFCELVLRETNLYAEKLKQKTFSPKSRVLAWKELEKEELLVFLGLILHMGNIKLNRLKDYWLTHRLYNVPAFHNYMGRNRFMSILRCLHFNQNPLPNVNQPSDRLYKIRPLLELFNKTISQLYNPKKELCIDESMILWRGRLLFRQYIKNKKHKYGIKLYLLTEPDGTILKVCVYTGQVDDLGGKGHAEKVVFHLMEGKLNAGHSIYMDNYYNSFTLSKKLLECNTYTTGTLRSNRKGTPDTVLKKKIKYWQYCLPVFRRSLYWQMER